MDNQENDYKFKIILLGEMGVGKTSMALRLIEDTFAQYTLTIGMDFHIKIINIGNKTIKIQIWDIAGSDRYRKPILSYYRHTSGIIIIYDISCRFSFEHIKDWIREIEFNGCSNARKILVGNKSDISEREVTEEEGNILADEFNMHFFETSCKTGDNVKEAFEFLIEDIVEDFEKNQKELNQKVKIDLKKEDKIYKNNKINKCSK